MKKQEALSHGDLIRECKKIESRMTKNLEEYCLAKFERGCLLKDVVFGEKRYGEGIMETVADELGYAPQTLYLEHSFAQMFNYDTAKLEKEIASLKKRDMRPSFEYFRKMLNPAKNPEAVGGVEQHAKLAATKIEALGTEVSDAIEQHSNHPEVQGAINAGVEVLKEGAAWLVGNVTHPGITLLEKIELPHYLKWLRTHPCVISGEIGVEAHHLILKARGQAALDFFALPMSKEVHDQYHAIGHANFERRHNVDTRLLCLGFIQEYIKEHRK